MYEQEFLAATQVRMETLSKILSKNHVSVLIAGTLGKGYWRKAKQCSQGAQYK
jgi:hypothetical protein